MILIITQFENDLTVVRLGQLLREQGADLVVVSPETLEQPSSFFIGHGLNGGVRSILRLVDREIDLREVQTAWLWRSWRPEPLLDRFRALYKQREEWRFFQQEWLRFHKSFSMTLAYYPIFCVNPPPWNDAFEEKCCQLSVAAEVGLCIPPTLYTTRLSVVHKFCSEHGGAIIYKPFRSYLRVIEPEGDHTWRSQMLFTNRVKDEDLVEPEGFLPTPGIFQPYIDKQIELRIVVIGRQLFTCAIHSQLSERSRDDWRHYDLEHTPYVAYELPATISQKLLHLMDRLHLVFGSIDMILTPEGEYIFLEVNPNGQFDFVAGLAHLPIYEHFAAMLMAGSVEYSVEALKVQGEVLNAD